MPIFRSPLRPLARALALTGLALLAACASPGPDHPPGAPFDPYEAQNRKVHAFNRGLDRKLVRPVAHGYSAVVPDDIETVVSRAAFNLTLPGDVVNNALQLNMRRAIEDTARFVVNSTIGLAGLFDPATEFGMPKASRTGFGETLHVWGASEGAYVELPVFGPKTERDAWALPFDLLTNPLVYVLPTEADYAASGIGLSAGLTQRTRRGEMIDSVLYESADSYAQTRSLYLQNRRFQLGDTGSRDYLDPYDDPSIAGPSLEGETDDE